MRRPKTVKEANIQKKKHNEPVDKVTPAEVAQAFKDFDSLYEIFRNDNNLSGRIGSAYEICTSLADKVGRICRYAKHEQRNDPKPDFPEGMMEEVAGVIIYLILLKNYYRQDFEEGIRSELERAVSQHSKEGKKMSQYSKAYQDVVAGRTREDEAIPFFGKNRISTSSGTRSIVGMGGKKQPTVDKDVLQHTGVGKPGTESNNLGAFNPPHDQVG